MGLYDQPLRLLMIPELVLALFSVACNSLIIHALTRRRRLTAQSVRLVILACLDILFALVKIFGADGYRANFDVESKSIRDERVRNISNDTHFDRGICALPMIKGDCESVQIVCLDWFLTKCTTLNFVVYIGIVRALSMNDLNFARADQIKPVKCIVVESFFCGILFPATYVTVMWITVFTAPRIVHQFLGGLYAVCCLTMLMVTSAMMVTIKVALQQRMQEANVKRVGGFEDRLKIHVLVMLLSAFCCHFPYVVAHFVQKSAILWLMSRFFSTLYSSLNLFILLKCDPIFRKCFWTSLGVLSEAVHEEFNRRETIALAVKDGLMVVFQPFWRRSKEPEDDTTKESQSDL